MKKYWGAFLYLIFCCCYAFSQSQNIADMELQALINGKSNEKVTINIVLNSRPDPVALKSKAAFARDVVLKRDIIVNELKSHSANTQQKLIAELRMAEKAGQVSEISSHWISNSITCKATPLIVKELLSHPDVLYVGLDKEYQIAQAIEDTPEAVAVGNIRKSATPHVLQVNADDVWKLGYTGKNVIVAILDSGINLDHYDLKDHLWTGYADVDGDGEKDDIVNGWNFIANNADIRDDYGHGTHCAGIVAGDGTVGNVTGIAPDATIMGVKIANRTGGGSPSQMIRGVQFAVENGADVLSLSLGFKKTQIQIADIEALRTTFENLLHLGVVACVAAGNDGDEFGAPDNVDFPAACPPPYIHPDQQVNSGGLSSVICVGSVNVKDEYVTTSSLGPVTWKETKWGDYPYDENNIGLIRPDVAAPGDLIYSLKHDESDKYKYMSGTSQATPCVAGIIALMLEKNSLLTPAEICETLEMTAKKLTTTKSNSTGSGRVDALAAINSIESANEKSFLELVEYSPKLLDGSGAKNINLSFVNNGKATSSTDAKVVITTSDPYVTLTNGEFSLAGVESGSVKNISIDIDIADDIPVGHSVYLEQTITDSGFSRSNEFVLKFDSFAKIVCRSVNKKKVKAGEKVVLTLEMVNAGAVATVAPTKVLLECSSPDVHITHNEAMLDIMAVGATQNIDFEIELDEDIVDNSNIIFDVYAVPNNYTDVKNLLYEFESGLDDDGYVIDGCDGWTTFDASNDGRIHPWWHSSMSAVHKVEYPGDSHSGRGHFMSETYCQASMMEYKIPVDNYVVSPMVKATTNSKFSFWARVHPGYWGEHFGVAISEAGNTSPDDFTTIEEWTINESDGNGWIEYTVDLSQYAGKSIYVAIRHFFTTDQWEAVDKGYDTYVLHVDDAMFTSVIDVSQTFKVNNSTRFSVVVESNPLPAPENLVAESKGKNSISLSWDAVENAESYNIYRNGVCIGNSKATSYDDTGLLSDTEYIYTVTAVCNNKEYAHSAEAIASTEKDDYSVVIKSVYPNSLAIGDNELEIVILNNGKKEHESRSKVTLSCDDPYVTVISSTASQNINALSPDAEVTRFFDIIVSDDVPDGHVVAFNLNVAYLYITNRAWDCSFNLTVGGDDSTTIVGSVENVEKSGVIYDMAGRLVKSISSPGIYIVNGKKIVVR